MQNIELNIKKFDIKKITPESTCVFVGKRKSGKTFLIKDLLYHVQNIPIGTVFTLTGKINKNFDDIIPPYFIKSSYKREDLERIFDVQHRKITALHERYKHIQDVDERMKVIKSDISNYCFVIMDDMLSDNSWKNDPFINRIFYEGRHYLIFFLLTMQIPLGIKPNLRSNIDFVFLTFTNNNGDIKKLYDNYGGAFENLEMFKKIFECCTSDYNCLVIDNTTSSRNFTDRVFYYKAVKRPSYKMCSPAAWALSAKKLNEQQISKTDNLQGKKAQYTINRFK